MRAHRVAHALVVPLLVGAWAGVRPIMGPSTQAAPQAAPLTYAVISPEGTRTLPARPAGAADLVPLDVVATFFDLTLREDAAARGLTVSVRGQRIVLTHGDALVSAGGRAVSLSAAVLHEGARWFVPVDFLSRALAPALGTRIEVRRASRLVLVGDVRVPQITIRFERAGVNARLVGEIVPPASHRVVREGGRLVIRFEADALDATPLAGAPADFIAGVRTDGASLVFDLGPAVSAVRSEDDRDPARLTVDLIASAGAPAPPRSLAPADALAGRPAPGTLRTIVIDPGHGGDEAGAKGPGGAVEKHLTLALALKIKALLESRLGVRVLLTREGDTTVTVDQRTALANNNKADLFVSLHANSAARPSVRGAQVISLSLADYQDRLGEGRGSAASLPVSGGGARPFDTVPWDLAQLPHARSAAAFAAIAARHLSGRGVTMQARATDEAPLRVLVGANMPAVLIEVAVLSHADDERGLTSGELQALLAEAITSAIMEIRSGIPASGGGRP